ncbi:hypothetical protein AURDEDRAFT_173958 [Auricularia subglabra TFB-10046 SS5]|uniref:F-box domain-containing protein n=1 Tax=Auricularia subglabra (strain TFB-10046 / SS5) TaxID=717982 RepID=J0WVE6_AURST|nr:hypothetical protein AURDEDRAFT_173958 [Auricularia subglabra TFB-10046 SS5]
MSRAHHLLGMPLEITADILSLLSFPDVVCVSKVCSELRKLAIAECRLWQTPPRMTVSELRKLTPCLGRAGKLGLDLAVREIRQAEIAELSVTLGALMPCLRELSLEFLTGEFVDYKLDLELLWHALQSPAPLLRRLALLEPVDLLQQPLSSIPPNIFSGSTPPNLTYIEITAFEITDICSAFARVPRVRTSVAALAQNHSTTRVHDLFPAVDTLDILGAEFGAISVNPYVLSRVPHIDRALEVLNIDWALEYMGSGEDPASEAWLREAAPFVRSLEICYPECPGATDAVLASLSGAGPLSVDICYSQWDDDLIEIIAAGKGITRTVTIAADDLTSNLIKLLELPGVIVEDVCVPATVENLQNLSVFWRCPSEGRLGLILDGDFMETESHDFRALNDVTTVGLHGPDGTTVDLRKVYDFLCKATPNVTAIRVCDWFHVLNAQALPPKVALQRVAY